MKDLGYLYHENVWVLPEYIYFSGALLTTDDYYFEDNKVKIKNENLRIKATFSDKNFWNCYIGGEFMVSGNSLGIEYGGTFYRININYKNLLIILSEYGASDGYLNGTYKLSNKTSEGFYLIPENIPEEREKTKISTIFRDKTKKFTKNLVQGNLYIGRSGNLFICLYNDQDLYVKGMSYLHSTYYLANYYKETPNKAKILMDYDLYRLYRGDGSIESIQKCVIKHSNLIRFYSSSYAGKDLGPFFKDDGRKLEDIASQIEDDSYSIGFVNKIIETCPVIKERFLEDMTTNLIESFCSRNPDFKKLYDRIRV